MLAHTVLLLCLVSLSRTPSDDTAGKAISILEQNCGNSGCHGGPGAYSFNVHIPSSLIEAKVVAPGKAADSELIRRVEAGIMPLGGYKGQPGAKLPLEDIQTLRQWIDAGALNPIDPVSSARRPFVSQSQILTAILNDLRSAGDQDRPYFRYYSLGNLWNNPESDLAELGLHRTALSKLVNHLSWRRDITRPRTLGPENLILRIDLRDYAWSADIWRRITASYPYAPATQELTETMMHIQQLSGVTVPYIRVDWFVATAGKPPLYHDILQLPRSLPDLEAMLHLDTAFDLQQNFAPRFGVRDSGVSRNNRAMERHSTVYGGYWKSFDFAGNNPDQDIFRDPVDLHADGGEVIFNLPNGLQGYFIVNKQGQRIDDAPVNIVRDRTNSEDPVVHNGRSCIGCHVKGMNAFRDQIVTTFAGRAQALFDLERARTLYPGQPELERLLEIDNHRFADALVRTGTGVPTGSSDEPVNRISRRYEATVSAAQAAADLSIEDPKTLIEFIAGNLDLQVQGFGQLLGARGGMKRDAWEQAFPAIAGQLGYRN
jgi:hypothetical protein